MILIFAIVLYQKLKFVRVNVSLDSKKQNFDFYEKQRCSVALAILFSLARQNSYIYSTI